VWSRAEGVFPYTARVHFAATVLQRYYARRHVRRCAAQTLTAALFRGHCVRRADRLVLARRHAAAIRIDRAWHR
jgi:hypothetical protein